MRIYLFLFLIIQLFASCSKYTIDDADGGDINVYIKFQKNASGDAIDMEYPVRVFCIDNTGTEMKDFSFSEGEEMKVLLSDGEYSINTFVGMDEDCYMVKNIINGKPMVVMKSGSVSDRPLRAAHTSLEIDKQTDVNLIPEYIVASAEMEFSNMPEVVESVCVEISPVSDGYIVDGGYTDETQKAVIECYKEGNKWVSAQKYFFPLQNSKTSMIVRLDYGEESHSYSYTFMDGFIAGQPYKFTGGFSNGMNMNGNFQIGSWNSKKEIILDFENEIPSDDDDEGDTGDGTSDDDVDTFIVDAIPEAGVIWGPFFVWKVEETGKDEALVGIISPDQWFKTFKTGEALEILSGYEIDGMTGWRTYTKLEAEEFYKEFSEQLDELNPYLEENGHSIFYTENRYLCENGEYAFNMFGSVNIRPAGLTVKYYLRPVKTIKLKVQK